MAGQKRPQRAELSPNVWKQFNFWFHSTARVFDPWDSRAEPQPRKGRELQRCSAMKPRAKDNGRLIKDSLWNQFSSSAPYLQKKKVELLSILPDNDAPAEAKEDRIGWRPIHWTSLISQRSAGYSPSGATREACSYRSTRQCSSGRRGRGFPADPLPL